MARTAVSRYHCRKISVSADIKDISEAAVGETLVCALEPNNSRDRNAAAIVAAGIRGVHADNGPH